MRRVTPFEILVILIAAGLFLWLAWWLLFANREVANAATAFDPSNCQYPGRTSNPPGGCDNSDPAVPECVLAPDEAACIKAFTEGKDVSKPGYGNTVAPAPLETVNPQKTVEAPHCTE